jgi:hypothetical protein
MHQSTVTFRRYVVTLSLALAAQPSFAASDCNRLPLRGVLPQWISSAAYVMPLNRIALVDALRNKVLFVDPRGQSQAYGGDDLGVPQAAMTPAIVNSTRDGFEVSMVDQQLYWYNSRFKRLDSQNLAKSSSDSRGNKVMGTYDSILAGDHFFSVGAVRWKGSLRLGFFRVPTANPSKFEFLGEIPGPSYYVLGHQYITALKGRDYALLMSNHPVILEFPRNGPPRTLDIFKSTQYGSIYNVPALKTQAVGPSSDEPMYREIEGLSIPIGLYGGRDGFLYLLTRESEAGDTTWRLFQINPITGKIVGEPMTLPTAARHLTAVLGTNSWYFVEKGSVLPAGNQEIRSMLEISNSAISRHAVPSQCPSR